MRHFETMAAHGAGSAHYEGAVSVPIFQTSTYSGSEQYSYSRCDNPTRCELEKTAALLEGGGSETCQARGFAFSSGLAAISAVFSLLRQGDRVLVSDDLYGGTYRLIRQIWSGFGITFAFADLRDPEAVEEALQTPTQMVFAETPTNPMMKVLPIRALSELASAYGAILAVDNTFLTPYYQRPLALGADLVIHSGTKFLSGHHDTSCGLVVARDGGPDCRSDPADRLALIQRTLGNALSPFDSWLTLRGMQTLPLRMEKHSQNALAAAKYLETHPRVERVNYPGLPSHPQYGLMREQTTGAGGVLSFSLKDDRVESVLHGGRWIRFAESLGGTTSLITYPQTQTHASIPAELRERIGITPRLLRLSVGLEHTDDLLEDLERMLR